MAFASRSSRILALAALAAVAFYALVERPRNRARDRAATEAARLTSRDLSGVDHVILARPGSTVDLAIRGTHWEMLGPVHDNAEASSVAQVISTIHTATVMRDLGPATDLSRYGLDPPDAAVTLIESPDTLLRVDVGSFSVDRSAVYARRPDGHVLLISADVRHTTTLAVEDYRNRRVATFDLSVVRAYTLQTPAERMRWQRGPGGGWFTVAGGDTVRGDSVAVPAVLHRLRGMRVLGFVADSDTAGAFDDPLATLRIERTEGPPLTVRFARGPAATYRARVDGEDRVVEVDDDAATIASRTLSTLRDRRLLHFAPLSAVRIALVAPDTSCAIVRAGDHWALPNPALGSIDPQRAADFVRSLLALQYRARLPAGSAKEDEANAFSLVVYASGDTILDELHVAPPRPGAPSAVAFSSSAGGPYEIAVSDLDGIVGALRRLRPVPTRP